MGGDMLNLKEMGLQINRRRLKYCLLKIYGWRM
jgi:hypothetical protein